MAKGKLRIKQTYVRSLIRHAINTYWKENRCPPSIRNIRTITGITSTSHIRFGRYGKPIPRWVDELFDEYKEIMEAIDEV